MTNQIPGYRFISGILYRLKREYGQPIKWFHLVSTIRNLDSGLLSASYLSQSIKRAVVFPSRLDREFKYSLSFIAANKNFTYGGNYDVKTRHVLIDNKELQLGVPMNINDFIELNERRYEIADIEEFADSKATLLVIKRLDAAEEPMSNNGIVDPAIATGVSAGEVITIGDLVFQNGTDVYLATNINQERPCLGVVVNILNGTIYHSRSTSLPSIVVQSMPVGTHRTLWLGTDGKPTFLVPSTGLRQEIGFATSQNMDGSYACVFNVSANVQFV